MMNSKLYSAMCSGQGHKWSRPAIDNNFMEGLVWGSSNIFVD